jgi:hypothetical protein
MSIAWNTFTPWTALTGGILIGIAVAVLVLFNGRNAGISGILSGLLKPTAGDLGWRYAFVFGLLIAPLAFGLIAPLPVSTIDASWFALIPAGLLVGYGTSMGTGCTSGHGVCGMARLAPRSLVATAVFMGVGIACVLVVRHLFGLSA